MMNKEEIMKILPYRPPMLMLDSVSEIEYGKKICAYKDIRSDEFWCEGHFPGAPVMPGALITETMAQAASVIIYLAIGKKNTRAYLSKIDNMIFLKKVYPECRLMVDAVLDIEIAGIFRFKCRAFVDGVLVAKGLVSCYVMKENDNCE